MYGYVEGRNLRLESRFAEGQDDRYPALAAELVALPVDIIVTWGTPATLAAQRATTTIPIVIGAIADPVSVGIVSNLARPEGNVTGFATQNVDPQGYPARRSARAARDRVRADRQSEGGLGIGLIIPPTLLARADEVIE